VPKCRLTKLSLPSEESGQSKRSPLDPLNRQVSQNRGRGETMVAANGILHVHSRREAELEKTRRIVSTCGLYLSRALTFVNGRAAES